MELCAAQQLSARLIVPVLCASCVGAMLLGSNAAFAQSASSDALLLPNVQSAASRVARVDGEKAVPVTYITEQDIRATGATSLVDLVRKLTATQGATGESSAVGGETFGFSGISIHNVGENRTLVLLNGRRLVQFGGQNPTGFAAAFDLNSIPLSAVEEIELITDGASAVYGADAIGGVVNIRTKQGKVDGDVSAGLSSPRGGALEKRLSVTKGFALGTDGSNALLSFSHDQRTPLAAADRAFSKTGQLGFTYRGKQYQNQNLSPFAAPANAVDDLGQFANPFRLLNGACPSGTFRVVTPYNDGTGLIDDSCDQDFVRSLETFPERKRDNFMATLSKKLGEHELFADVLLSRTSQVSRIAAVPGTVNIFAGTPLHNQYLLPLGITVDSSAYYRLSDLGQRTSSDTAEFAHLAVGSRGKALGWTYDLAYNHSESKAKSRIVGYPGKLAVQSLVDNGLLDPFVGPGQQTPAAQAALAASAYNGYWNGGVSRLDVLGLTGDRDVGELGGGAIKLSTGANLSREFFAAKPSLFAQRKLADPAAGTLCDNVLVPCDERFGDAGLVLPYSASRTSAAMFGALLMPVTKTLDLGAALRLDHYSDFGNATTGKASFKWLPTDKLLVRGSIGNGFHAPTVPQVKAAVQSGGFTSDSHACTPALQAVATAQGAVCQPGQVQYDVLFAGNPRLQAEKSRQASLGFRLDSPQRFTVGADLWHVQIANRFGQLTEQVVFANPGAFPNSWSSRFDGVDKLAFLQDNQNLGKSYATGIDMEFKAFNKTDFGDLTTTLALTHVLREVAQLQKGGKYFSAVGNFAELGTVTFRTQGRAVFSLKTSNTWTHILAVNFKSGYKDQETTLNVLDASGNVTGTEDLRIHVKSYATVDWQSEWSQPGASEKANRWRVNAGVLNLFNRAPPFAVSTSGLDRGSQYGYDDRYYDPRGRTMYVNAAYSF